MDEVKRGVRFIDPTGQVFGRLTVNSVSSNNNGNGYSWNCTCTCGNTCVTRAVYLRTGKTKSCGCWNKEKAVTHGMYKHLAYGVWHSIKNRTTNPNDANWRYYGGRGIKMCQEWEDSFIAFWSDMGATYEEGLTLDRIDNNKGYYKRNCRWVSQSMQLHNQRKRTGNSSQFIGVYYHKLNHKFVAEIRDNGKGRYLGSFMDEHDAAVAYDDASEEIFGDRPNGTVREIVDKPSVNVV